MGLLVNGKWVDEWYDTAATGGRFMRSQAQFRNWVTADGSAGPTGEAGFRAEAGRYHLYVSLACPWAHRTLIFRVLKGLERMIDVSVVNPYMDEHGWTFEDAPGVIADPILAAAIYMKSIAGPSLVIAAGLRCRCCGTGSTARLSAMSRPKSSACSTLLLTASAPCKGTIRRLRCLRESTRSTRGYMSRSITGSTRRASPPVRAFTKGLWRPCSTVSMSLSGACPAGAICWASVSRSPTGDCSPP
jgi:hypothetical protein